MGARGPAAGTARHEPPRRRGALAPPGRWPPARRVPPGVGRGGGPPEILALFGEKAYSATPSLILWGVAFGVTRQNAWGGVRRGFFPSLFMSALGGLTLTAGAHYQNPFLISSKPFRLRGYCSAGRQ